jgi:hypothetical protein
MGCCPRGLAGLALVSLLSGCAGNEPGAALGVCSSGECGVTAPAAFSIVVLPDTQFYAEAYHHIFKDQTEWILNNRAARRIAFVLHEGDIVNVDMEEQWGVADRSLHLLDGKVPYVLSAGNHDYPFKGGRISRDCDLLNRHFPASALAALPWPTGTFEEGRVENQYQLLDAFGTSFLVLSLEYGPRNAVVDWADRVLEQYGGVPAIIVTHAYLARDGKRFQRQPFRPCGPAPNEFDDCNDGEMIWNKLVARHENVVFVFSGHDLFPGVAQLSSQRASGRHVHQILANYQTCGGLPCTIPFTDQITEGGDGFLRIVTIDPGQRTAQVESYSPYFDKKGRDPFRHEPQHQFTLALDAWPFLPAEPRAAVAFAPLEQPDRLVVRRPLDRIVEPKPRPVEKRCDGIQVVLSGVDALGQPGSARTVQACLDGACESFTIDERLICGAASLQSRTSCVNDEGMLRLFFSGARGPRPVVSVVARDAAGTSLLEGSAPVDARPADGAGECWTGLHVMRGRPSP